MKYHEIIEQEIVYTIDNREEGTDAYQFAHDLIANINRRLYDGEDQ